MSKGPQYKNRLKTKQVIALEELYIDLYDVRHDTHTQTDIEHKSLCDWKVIMCDIMDVGGLEDVKPLFLYVFFSLNHQPSIIQFF